MSWPTLCRYSITALTLLGRLSTRFRSVSMGMFDHSSRSPFVRLGTDVRRESLTRSLHSNSSQRCFYRIEVRTLCRPVRFHCPKRWGIMVWSCFPGVGLGPLVTVKVSAHQDILDNFMLPTLWEQFGDGPFLFQQDCVPAHKARSIKTGVPILLTT